MNDTAMSAWALALCLILPLSALVARRLPLKSAAKMAAAWIAVFAVGLLIAGSGDRIASAWRDLSGKNHNNGEATVVIPVAADGHFWADAEIDGVRRRMLIDSGATMSAVSAATARAAKIDAEATPFARIVETANGAIAVQPATVRTLQVGAIAIHDLPVTVIASSGNDILGMDFLGRLRSWRVEGHRMYLTP